MKANIQVLGTIITILGIVGAIIFNLATVSAKVNENTASISERKLTGTTVRKHSNRLIRLETTEKHYGDIHAGMLLKEHQQDAQLDNIRTRVRVLEQKK